MTDETTHRILDQLNDLERELRAFVESIRMKAKPVVLDQSSVGRLSRMDSMQQQSMAQAKQRQAERRLMQVRAARRALHDGEYGVCAQCDEKISQRRLEVRPESLLCLQCQREGEA